jgi:monoterpene epsilon-lactone hydrolase
MSCILMLSQSQISAWAQNSNSSQSIPSSIYIPATISREAQDVLKNLTMSASTLVTPHPDDIKGWQNLNQQISSMLIGMSKPLVDIYQPNITAAKLGNVTVLDIKPKDWRDNGKVLVYLHGGGHTFLGANSTLGFTLPVANSTGLRIVSIDYTLAPVSKWNQTMNEVLSVIQALIKEQGYSIKDIAIYGDSAGGGLAAGSVLKMRDEGIGIPSAIVLWSPWIDVTGKGDTYVTLEKADPITSANLTLKNMANAYANPSDQKNPYVSPVYGNFSKGFPPTLIQGGTKDILLSDFVRLYQAIDQAKIPVKLDIYEGMPHDFQYILLGTPESNLAISKMDDFLRGHLIK